MQTIVATWGNSLGIRIPKSYAGDLGIENGTRVELVRTGNSLVIKPKKEKRRKKFKIETLAKNMTDENAHDAVKWGEPVGREVW